MSDAVDRARAVAAQYPTNELVRFNLGKALLENGDFAGAQAELAFCTTRKPGWMVAWILAGRCKLSLGDRAAAKAAFEAALKLAIEQHHEGPQVELEALLRELA